MSDDAQQVLDDYLATRAAKPALAAGAIPPGYRWLHELLRSEFGDASIEHSLTPSPAGMRAKVTLSRNKKTCALIYPFEGDARLAIGDGCTLDFVKRARVELA